MRWPDVLRAITLAVHGNSVLSSVFPGGFRKAADAQEYRVPSLEYTLVASGVSELWEPHTVQFSLHCETLATLAAAEGALAALFDHEIPQIIEGIWMWSTYLDAADLPGPSRESYYGRAVRFEFTPIRSRIIAGRS